MVGRRRLPDIQYKIEHARVMRSRDTVKLGTPSLEEWIDLYLRFGSVNPHLFGAGAV